MSLALAVPRRGVSDSTGERVGRTPVAVTLGVTVESPPAPLGEATGEVLGVGVGSLVTLAEPVPAALPKREGEGGGEEDACTGEAVASGEADTAGEAVPAYKASAGRDGEAPEVGVPALPSPPAPALACGLGLGVGVAPSFLEAEGEGEGCWAVAEGSAGEAVEAG